MPLINLADFSLLYFLAISMASLITTAGFIFSPYINSNAAIRKMFRSTTAILDIRQFTDIDLIRSSILFLFFKTPFTKENV